MGPAAVGVAARRLATRAIELRRGGPPGGARPIALSRGTQLRARSRAASRRCGSDAEGRQHRAGTTTAAGRLHAPGQRERPCTSSFARDQADRVVEERRVGGTRVQHRVRRQRLAVVAVDALARASATRTWRSTPARNRAGIARSRCAPSWSATPWAGWWRSAPRAIATATATTLLDQAGGGAASSRWRRASGASAALRPLHRTCLRAYDRLGNASSAETAIDETQRRAPRAAPRARRTSATARARVLPALDGDGRRQRCGRRATRARTTCTTARATCTGSTFWQRVTATRTRASTPCRVRHRARRPASRGGAQRRVRWRTRFALGSARAARARRGAGAGIAGRAPSRPRDAGLAARRWTASGTARCAGARRADEGVPATTSPWASCAACAPFA
jgi:hypothetical protein